MELVCSEIVSDVLEDRVSLESPVHEANGPYSDAREPVRVGPPR